MSATLPTGSPTFTSNATGGLSARGVNLTNTLTPSSIGLAKGVPVSLDEGIRNMLASGAQLPIALVVVGIAFMWAGYRAYLYCKTLSHAQDEKAHDFALSRERVLHSEREAESAGAAHGVEVNFTEARARGVLSDEDIGGYDLHGRADLHTHGHGRGGAADAGAGAGGGTRGATPALVADGCDDESEREATEW